MSLFQASDPLSVNVCFVVSIPIVLDFTLTTGSVIVPTSPTLGLFFLKNCSYQQSLPSSWHQNISGRNSKIKRRAWYDLMRFLICINSYIVSFSSSFFKLGHSVHGFAGGKGPVLTAIDLVTLSIFFGSSLGDIEVPWDLDSFVWPSCWV